jgi:hypothetical protein
MPSEAHLDVDDAVDSIMHHFASRKNLTEDLKGRLGRLTREFSGAFCMRPCVRACVRATAYTPPTTRAFLRGPNHAESSALTVGPFLALVAVPRWALSCAGYRAEAPAPPPPPPPRTPPTHPPSPRAHHVLLLLLLLVLLLLLLVAKINNAGNLATGPTPSNMHSLKTAVGAADGSSSNNNNNNTAKNKVHPTPAPAMRPDTDAALPTAASPTAAGPHARGGGFGGGGVGGGDSDGGDGGAAGNNSSSSSSNNNNNNKVRAFLTE